MQVRLKQPAFLEGSRRPAGALLDDYQGPLADWMEVVGDGGKAPPKRRRSRAE